MADPFDWSKIDVDNIELTGLSKLTKEDISSVYSAMTDAELASVLSGMAKALLTAQDRQSKVNWLLKTFMTIGQTAVKGLIP